MAIETKISPAAIIQASIETDGEEFNLNRWLERLEWRSFINNGYIVKLVVEDPRLITMRDIATKFYLEKARKQPTKLKFKIKWAGGEETPERIAYLVNIYNTSATEHGRATFVAIDPPSWWLNAGDADGSAWEGNISKVIKDVITFYASEDPEGISVEVSPTDDNEQNIWYMMRQDPKTFISSLLEWSSPVTTEKTQWVVASVDNKILVKKQEDLTSVHLGNFVKSTSTNAPGDIIDITMLSDNVTTVLQHNILTAGISAVTGEYLDKEMDTEKNLVHVNDANTGSDSQGKINVEIGEERGFAHSGEKPWATQIAAVPEFSAGELGIPYRDYISGRARSTFLNMLYTVMRAKVRIYGYHKIEDSSQLGIATINILWDDADDQSYFLSGNWLLYGFRHIVKNRKWYTDLYVYRLDYDAKAKKVGPKSKDKGTS